MLNRDTPPRAAGIWPAFVLIAALGSPGCDRDRSASDQKTASTKHEAASEVVPAEPATEVVPAEPAAGLRPPPAEFPKVAKQELEWDDFLTILGLERGEGLSEERVVATLGEPDERSESEPLISDDPNARDLTLRYEGGPSITLRASGGVQFNLFEHKEKMRELYPGDPAVSLLGQTCEEAQARLQFMDEVGSYSTCKHYTDKWFLDVTLMCRDDVSTVTVVWEPLPEEMQGTLPPDHC